jgi:hypothetical protein
MEKIQAKIFFTFSVNVCHIDVGRGGNTAETALVLEASS